MRGDNYTTTETYTDSQGRTQTRIVVRTRWWPVSGEVQHFFDDVLVCGSKSVPPNLVRGMQPWNTSELEPFQDQFLAGLKTERYAVDLKEGLVIAKRLMEPAIMSLIREDIGGDHQQIHSTDTRYLGVTFKHCLLPVWIANYRFHEKLYQILINGRTGKVSGERPYSWWKIGALVLVILTVVAAILTVVMTAKGSSDGVPDRVPAKVAPKRAARSRREPVPRPGSIPLPNEQNPVVQPAGPPLPEFKDPGEHAIPAPVRGAGDIAIRKLDHKLGVLRLQEGAIRDFAALR
jgi:hypothetical protein